MPAPNTELSITALDGIELLRRVVDPGEYLIGAGAACDVSVDAPGLAERHARLIVRHEELLLEALGSSEITQIAGQTITGTARFWPGQEVRLGSVKMHARRVPAGHNAALPPPWIVALREKLPPDLLRERYAIGPMIAQGGMGAILAARDGALGRSVAMKLMLDPRFQDDLTRFIEEARVTGQLEHPGIVPIYELGVDVHEQAFYTMRYVSGVTLKKALAQVAAGDAEALKKWPLAARLTVFQKVCDAVAFAHSRGVIHRDLKPENVMLGDFGEVLVMDWGLAKRIEARPLEVEGVADTDPPSDGEVRPSSIDGTLSGAILGTPGYMAPEQTRGESLDARADIYALGAILFEILTLRPLIESATADDALSRVFRGEAESALQEPWHLAAPPGDRAVPDSLAAVVRKAAAQVPDARYASVPALQGDIAAFQSGFATQAEHAGLRRQLALLIRRNRVASIAAALIVALSAGFMAKVISSERTATAHLARLRATAPTFAEHARALVSTAASDPRALPAALENIEHALGLTPGNADFYRLRGEVLQSLGRFEEAHRDFAQAGRLDPQTPFAAENARLSAELAGPAPAEEAREPRRVQLYTAMLAQGRHSEAAVLAGTLFGNATAAQKALEHWRAWLAAHGIGAADRALRIYDGHRLGADLSHRPQFADLSPLRDMPLHELRFIRTKVSDLSPLRGMPLTRLHFNETPVRDLEPLRGMQLWELGAGNTGVTDLAPLRGMPLQRLVLGGTGVTDFSPLAGMPLETLSLWAMPVRDLGFLREAPLRDLGVRGCEIADLTPLTGKPLRGLNLNGNPVHSLEPLRGMPLRTLDIGTTNVSDLSPLAGAPLEVLDIAGLHIPDLEILRGKRLTRLSLEGTAIRDLAPLAGMPLRSLDLRGCERIEDFAPLRDLLALEDLMLPRRHRDIAFLRGMKKLKRISYEAEPKDATRPRQTAEDFWKEHDAKR